VFVALYLGTSLVLGDFYQIPITVPFLLASVYALLTLRGSMKSRIDVFSSGAGDSNVLLMVWIFVLAGAFASTAKSMGAIDATVSLTLRALPDTFLLPGIFLASCAISFAIGTSVGTVAALTPVAVGIAQQAQMDVTLLVGIVISGAYFGDNLSFISDTTIVATQSQGCKMNDKFKVNFRIVLPVALLVFAYYVWANQRIDATVTTTPVNYLLVVPYLSVIIAALMGVNVVITLALGIALSATIGILTGAYTPLACIGAMADGMKGMSELILITLMASGILAVIKHNGGIEAIIHALTRRIHGKRAAEASIAALVALVNVCTANNTVAIITTGGIAKQITEHYGLDRRKTASILDTAACCTQAILPYGAQMLIAAGLAQVNPVSLIHHLLYPMLLALALILAILFRFPRKYS